MYARRRAIIIRRHPMVMRAVHRVVRRGGFCLALVAAGLLAQQPAAETPAAQTTENNGTTFRSSVEEVIVPVTVTDDRGRFVSNLERKDFEIVDNGRRQTINYFSRERAQPVVVGFLIDLS